MKINEKNLVSFATCNSHVDKEGSLLKRGDMNKAYQKRWFVLKGNLLFYFEKRTDREPIGVIILEGCTVELSESSDFFGFEIVFPGNTSRTYVLKTDTQEDMEAWMKAIACAGYDYMKLMVTELQRQLDELTTNKYMRPTQPAPSTSSSSKSKSLIQPREGAAVAGHSSSSQLAASRFNPFDGLGSDQLDSFGAVPFSLGGPEDRVSTVSTISNPYRSRPRSFEEMHEEFGYHINERQKEYAENGPESARMSQA